MALAATGAWTRTDYRQHQGPAWRNAVTNKIFLELFICSFCCCLALMLWSRGHKNNTSIVWKVLFVFVLIYLHASQYAVFRQRHGSSREAAFKLKVKVDAAWGHGFPFVGVFIWDIVFFPSQFLLFVSYLPLLSLLSLYFIINFLSLLADTLQNICNEFLPGRTQKPGLLFFYLFSSSLVLSGFIRLLLAHVVSLCFHTSFPSFM